MRNILYIFFLLLLCACSKPSNFNISGEIEGAPTMNLYVRYYANGAIRSGVVAVREGKFEYKGSSPDTTLVFITDNIGTPLSNLIAVNGDKIECRIDRSNSFKINAKGSPILELWSAVANSLATDLLVADAAGRNSIIENYIAQNPDSPVGTLLFLTAYDASPNPLRADSVIGSVNLDARLSKLLGSFYTMNYRFADSIARIDTMRLRIFDDSIFTYIPSDQKLTLLTFSQDQSFRTDTLTPALKTLHKSAKKKGLKIIDFSLSFDSLAWLRSVRRDTADYIQAWVPGGILSPTIYPLDVTQVPFFIVADSIGKQIYRGVDLDSAITVVNR